MLVTLRSRYAGPHGTFQPGATVDLPDGAALVEAGAATPAEASDEARAPEAATEEPDEAAVAPKPRGRRRRAEE